MVATRAALVVAADQFVDPKFQRLRAPAEDVEGLAGVLGDAAIGGFDVQTVVNQPCAVVQQELERFFSDRKPDDLLLLYFSCHGVKDPTGRLYFVTSDTSFDLLRSTGVSATFVSEQMEYSRSKRIVVMLDCCYSGAFLKGFRARGDDSVAVDQLEGRGRAVITASRSTEYAFEADELATDNAQPSMFTGAIVHGLATGSADRDGDGLITVDELYDYVYDEVRAKVEGQTPGRWVDVEGDLVVARNPTPIVRPADLAPELRHAIESDLALQRLGAVSELAQWYHSGDPQQQLAAQSALEQLSNDYDGRVKVAAIAALAPPAGADAPVVAAEPVPLTLPSEPAPTAPVLRPSTAPAAVVPVDRTIRVAGVLAGLGGLAVLFAPYFAFLEFDGSTNKLADQEWFSLGAFVIFGIALFGAYCLLRSTTSTATGLVVLAALIPVSVGDALAAMGRAAHDTSVTGARAGWVLHVLGFACIFVAGVVAALRLRRYATLSPPSLPIGRDRRFDRGTAATLAALVVGAAIALGWAKDFQITGDAFLDVADPVQDLVVRLVVVTAAACVGLRWIQGGGVKARAIIGGSIVVFVGPVVLFLTSDGILGREYWLYPTAFAALALGAVIVPVLASVLRPERLGVAALAAWLGATAAWVPTELANHEDADLLAVALLAGAALAGGLALVARNPAPATDASTP